MAEVKPLPRYQVFLSGQELKLVTLALRGKLKNHEDAEEAKALAISLLKASEKVAQEQVAMLSNALKQAETE